MMKTRWILAILITLMSLSSVNAQQFAVVELFTSQGCSSCPAADKNLSDILQQAERNGKTVYALSFHVDYWNNLGWKDPYSSKEYTARQRWYGDLMKSPSIYTPQMIVNGVDEFIGADKPRTEEALRKAFSSLPSYTITISDVFADEGMINLHYALDKSPVNETLNIAVVERNVENFVPRGENKGKRLHHDNVVQSFRRITVKKEGDVEVNLPVVNKKNTMVILYIQDTHAHIIGAAAHAL